MKNKVKLLSAVALVATMCISTMKAQDTLKATAEIVSSYVWRGSLATQSPTPNFQPTLAYGHGPIEIGIWGSTGFVPTVAVASGNGATNAQVYKEFDPYIAYTVNSMFKVTLTDYNWNFDYAKYFDYKNTETGHMFEGTIGYTGPSTMPVSVTWNTMFYGLDKKRDATGKADSSKQAYSTYIELGYTKGAAAFFFGFTPWKSYYTNYTKDFAVVNIGTTISRSIKITNDFSLPVRATLVINPAAATVAAGNARSWDYVHLIFGITF